jgi:hypothetical protein
MVSIPIQQRNYSRLFVAIATPTTISVITNSQYNPFLSSGLMLANQRLNLSQLFRNQYRLSQKSIADMMKLARSNLLRVFIKRSVARSQHHTQLPHLAALVAPVTPLAFTIRMCSDL